MKTRGPVLIAAGGTGGHLFPAEALGNALKTRGIAVELATDARAKQYGGDFPAQAIHQIASATPSGGTIIARTKAILTLLAGTLAALRLLRRLRPAAVVGFGGYPTVPPVLAASLLHIPTILHEQNAILGRANRFLAGRVDAVAMGFPTLKGAGSKVEAKAFHTGNPVRPNIVAAAKETYPEACASRFTLLITGGSQGARIMADVVPAAVALMPEPARKNLIITQQARRDDQVRVQQAYADLAIAAEVLPFFADLPARMAAACLVIARAGASTIAELSVIGRPAILVPFPHALDQDQAANAAYLGANGAAIVVAQKDFSPQWLASTLCEAQKDPAALQRRAAAARSVGVANAADRLADLVLGLAQRGVRT
jgi:UDP-N-acetylglucosamine--N-acetylmuramyl-(pentapeptide) pyrophosphoryl-undecaprenol N-acetylglucosamine transferase